MNSGSMAAAYSDKSKMAFGSQARSKALCLIPARGGSKRIPRKNIRPLHGRPLLGWVIAAAQGAGCFDEVMVSTDDVEIAAVARDCGASVPFLRQPATAGDHATTTDVIREVLDSYATQGDKFDLVCCVYATAALLRPEHLFTGYRRLLDDAALDSVMAVQAYRHPIERAYRMNNGVVWQVDSRQHAVRTQDIELAYHDAGQFYWFRSKRFASTGRVLGERCAPVVLEAWEAVDLDNEADWQFLERLIAMPAAVSAGGAA